MLPVVPLKDTPVPARRATTPVFSTFTVPVVALDVTAIPFPAVNVLKLLALANKVSKFTLVFVQAVYRESLPTDSLGKPTLIFCFPVIAIKNKVPYVVFINKEHFGFSRVRKNSRNRK